MLGALDELARRPRSASLIADASLVSDSAGDSLASTCRTRSGGGEIHAHTALSLIGHALEVAAACTRDVGLYGGSLRLGSAAERPLLDLGDGRLVLERVLEQLAKAPRPDGSGVVWWTPDALSPRGAEDREGDHGRRDRTRRAGVIARLAHALAHGIKSAQPLLERAVRLLAQRLPSGSARSIVAQRSREWPTRPSATARPPSVTSTTAATSCSAKTGFGTRRHFRSSARVHPSQAGVELAVLAAATDVEPGRDAVMLLSTPWP